MSTPLLIEGSPVLSDRELTQIIRLVRDRSGIALTENKRALVVARLQKRLRTGGFRSFADYLKHVEGDDSGQEVVSLLDAIATNHTSFFREPQHFELLRDRVIPELASGGKPIEGWCAACSTGEEPLTIVMTLLETLPERDHGRLRLLASDISTKALAAAESRQFRVERLKDIPIDLLRRYFQRGVGARAGWGRATAELYQPIDFRRLNLLEIDHLGRSFDFIFCRNVMIYFDRPVQQQVVSMLERHLRPGGYLFISHSESLNGISHGLSWLAPAVYWRRPS